MKNIRSIILPVLAILAGSLFGQSSSSSPAPSVIAQLQTIAAEQAQLSTNIKNLQTSAAALVSTNTTLTTANTGLTSANAAKAATITTLQAQNATLTAQVATLQAQLNSSGQITADLQKALDDLKAASKANADLLNGGGSTSNPPPPPTDDVGILADVTDNTQAGVNKRLGATAPAGMVLPTVWERPQAQTTDTGFGKPFMNYFSQGLSITGSGNFDYGSTDDNILAAFDPASGPLAVDSNGMPVQGLGVFHLRTEEHSGGQVQTAPTTGWNSSLIEPDSVGHFLFGPQPVGKIGRPIAVARAKINRYDVGVVLYDESGGGVGYFGTVGTPTAHAPWSGTTLPAGKIPLCIAVSSQNEFVLVGVHDRATGKGQLLIYWNWAGNDLQQKAVGMQFPPDFPVAHPGLTNSGVVTGVKLFGVFDLPIKWPTSVDCVCSPNTTGDRIEGPDGNASYLNIWALDTQSQRDAFLARNGGWISTWGKAAVASRYENKVVMIDLAPLFAGVRDQYFGSQANYDATAYTSPGGNWWSAYDINNPQTFPWGVEARPSWAPVITKVIDVPASPTAMLMSEHGDAEVATTSLDGYVNFFKFDGSADGRIHVGDNPVHLSHDKAAGIRNGGPVVTCRASRSVVLLSGWGSGATITTTVQDSALLDPVAADVGDTHGLQMRYITIADFNGKAIRGYRLSPLILATQGGATFGMGPTGTDAIERTGSFIFQAKPFALSDSNVN